MRCSKFFCLKQIDWLLKHKTRVERNGKEVSCIVQEVLSDITAQNRRFLRWQMYCVLSSSPHTVLTRPAHGGSLVRKCSHSHRAPAGVNNHKNKGTVKSEIIAHRQLNRTITQTSFFFCVPRPAHRDGITIITIFVLYIYNIRWQLLEKNK